MTNVLKAVITVFCITEGKSMLLNIIVSGFVIFANLYSTEEKNFFKAIEQGDVAKVTSMLKNNKQLVHAKEYQPPFNTYFLFSDHNNDDLTEKMAQSPRFLTPLHMAFDLKLLDISKILLEAGADINADGLGHQTPLFYALRRNSFYDKNILEFLIKNKADLYVESADGFTPLHLIVQNFDKELLEKLVLQGFDLNVVSKAHGDTLLHVVAMMNDSEKVADMVTFLLDHGVMITKNKYDREPVLYTKQNGFVDKAFSNYLPPLYRVFEKNATVLLDTIKKFPKMVLVTDKNKNTALHLAILKDDQAILKKILDFMFNHQYKENLYNVLNNNGKTALQLAIESDCKECTDLLLKADAGIYQQDEKNGDSVLHLLVKKDSLLTKEVLEKHTKLCALQNKQGETALIVAAREGSNQELFESLVTCSEIVQDKQGATPFTVALFNMKNKKAFDILVEKKSDKVNMQNSNGDTILHYLVNHSSPVKNFKKLFTYGVNPFIKNNQNELPLDLVDEDYSSLKTMIIEYMLDYSLKMLQQDVNVLHFFLR